MLSVVFARTGGIEKLVVLLNQIMPPRRVFPYPFLESVLDGLLLLLRKRGLLGIEHALLSAVCILNGVVNAHVAQIQRVLQNLVGIGAFRAVGHIGVDIAAAYNTLAGDIPFCAEIRVVDINAPAHIESRLQQLKHELPDILFVDPRCTEAYFNFRSVQILGLRLFQSRNIGGVVCKAVFWESGRGVAAGNAQLLADIAGEIFICCLPLPFYGVKEDNAGQLIDQIFLTFAGELRHIVHVHAGFFRYGQCQRFRRRIYGCDGLMGTDRALCENVRLALEVVFFIQHFQRAEQEVRAVVRKRQIVGAGIDKPVFRREGIIEVSSSRCVCWIAASETKPSICCPMSFCTQSRSCTMPLTRSFAVAFRSGLTMTLFSR